MSNKWLCKGKGTREKLTEYDRKLITALHQVFYLLRSFELTFKGKKFRQIFHFPRWPSLRLSLELKSVFREGKTGKKKKDRGYIESERSLRLLCASFFKCQYQETEVGKVKIGNLTCSLLSVDNTFLDISLYGIEK